LAGASWRIGDFDTAEAAAQAVLSQVGPDSSYDAAAARQALGIVAFGAVIGLLGSATSVGRHLKRV
jgi:hypothetical protein